MTLRRWYKQMNPPQVTYSKVLVLYFKHRVGLMVGGVLGYDVRLVRQDFRAPPLCLRLPIPE